MFATISSTVVRSPKSNTPLGPHLSDFIMTSFSDFVESRPAVLKQGEDVQTHTENYATLLTSKGPEGYQFIIESGRKYHKVIMVTEGGNRSVHCFVDKKNGDVYKAESWKRPAKHVRYNLLDEYSRESLFDECEWAGSHLYLR